MTFIWVSQSDGSSPGTVFPLHPLRRDPSGAVERRRRKNPTEFRNQKISHLKSEHSFMVHSTKERMSSHVRPWLSLWNVQLHCLVQRVVCVYWGTHTPLIKREILKLQSTRGITELSAWLRDKVSQCFWFLWTLCVFRSVWSPPEGQTVATGCLSKGSSLPRLVGV